MKNHRPPQSGLDLDSVAEAVAKLITQRVCPSSATGAVLVGYSMGARLALRTAASHPECAASTVSIGGSGGIRDERQRALRADRDDSMAEALADGGVGAFVNAWYRQGLFRSLSAHPRWRDGAVARRRAEMFEMSARLLRRRLVRRYTRRTYARRGSWRA